jgi:tRNA threonylcarbamoyladenosine biosynthesis protein TsaE
MTNQQTFAIENEAGMELFGAQLAEHLPLGSVIALNGTLGAGKTRLVQAVCARLNIPVDQVTSPTFTLVQEYTGEKKVFHLDAYRVDDIDEFEALGVSEIFSAEALIFVEWANKVSESMPRDHFIIEIQITGEQSRLIKITGTRENSAAIAKKITAEFS